MVPLNTTASHITMRGFGGKKSIDHGKISFRNTKHFRQHDPKRDNYILNSRYILGNFNSVYFITMEEKTKRPVGAPKKAPTFKPSLRCRVDTWRTLQSKYPKQLNAMFNAWLESLK